MKATAQYTVFFESNKIILNSQPPTSNARGQVVFTNAGGEVIGAFPAALCGYIVKPTVKKSLKPIEE